MGAPRSPDRTQTPAGAVSHRRPDRTYLNAVVMRTRPSARPIRGSGRSGSQRDGAHNVRLRYTVSWHLPSAQGQRRMSQTLPDAALGGGARCRGRCCGRCVRGNWCAAAGMVLGALMGWGHWRRPAGACGGCVRGEVGAGAAGQCPVLLGPLSTYFHGQVRFALLEAATATPKAPTRCPKCSAWAPR